MCGEVLRIQYSRNLGIAFVKTTCLEVALKIVDDNDDKHELSVDGKAYKLHLMMEDGAVEVKLFNLSEDAANEKLAKVLGAYGEVLSIREELCDDIFSPGFASANLAPVLQEERLTTASDPHVRGG